MSADLSRFITLVWPYAAGFIVWIAACAYAESNRTSRHAEKETTL
jgi:hypothetical protein